MNRTLILAGLLATSAFVPVACGGQSVEHSDDDGKSGASGASGSSGSGNGGTAFGGTSAGGTFTGGTFAGGASAGGTSAGGTFAGGTSAGGTSAGGASFGGTSAGGSSAGGVAGTGTSGAGGVCSLPLVTGPCDAYIPSFGFSQADGRCVPFVYGGCEGNDNRFSTLVECEARCGGSLSKCPPVMPRDDVACLVQGQVCTYDFEDCLCTPTANFSCPKVDRACASLATDAGVSPIVIPVYHQCTCENLDWFCNIVTVGGR